MRRSVLRWIGKALVRLWLLLKIVVHLVLLAVGIAVVLLSIVVMAVSVVRCVLPRA